VAAHKDDVGLHWRPGANRQGILAETVALLEQQKRVAFDLCQVRVARRRQPMVSGNDHVQPFAKEFMAQATAWNRHYVLDLWPTAAAAEPGGALDPGKP